MNQTELNEILQLHEAWLEDDVQGERAILRDAILRDADLRGADLRGADLSGAYLCNVDLSNAVLRNVDLNNAVLRNVDLSNVDLRNAVLRNVDLNNAVLHGAVLRGADLRGADLKGTFALMMCPEEGAYIGWKKCRDELIVKLQITEDALRSSATSRKCRASKAVVLAIENIDGTNADVDYAVSIYDRTFKYVVGETVEVKDFDRDRWNECAPGIHHFITRQEAVDY